jgi:hypothetical protein
VSGSRLAAKPLERKGIVAGLTGLEPATSDLEKEQCLLGDRLFAYFEYIAADDELATRTHALAAAPRMREWWDSMEPMQVPDPNRPPGTWWSEMTEVIHQD